MKSIIVLFILMLAGCGVYDPDLWIKPFNYSVGMGYKQKANIPVYLSVKNNGIHYVYVKTENKEIISVPQNEYIIEKNSDIVMVQLVAKNIGLEVLSFILDEEGVGVELRIDVTGEKPKGD